MSDYQQWVQMVPLGYDGTMAAELAAPVLDPCWFLLRQLHFGEFEHDGGSSPVDIEVTVAQAQPSRMKAAAGGQEAVEIRLWRSPLEAVLEQEPVPSEGLENLRMRAESGLRLQRLLRAAGLSAQADTWATRGRFVPPARAILDDETRDWYDTMTGRVPDARLIGGQVARIITGQDTTTVLAPGELDVLKAWNAGTGIWEHSARGQGNWDPEQLEYRLSAGAVVGGGEVVLDVPEYVEGTLDWYAFDVGSVSLGLSGQTGFAHIHRLPVPLQFVGMPNNRFWSFEDPGLNFDLMELFTRTDRPPSTATMMALDFALSYGDDWCQVPLPLPAHAVCEIQSVVITDCFGDTVDRATPGRPVEPVPPRRPERPRRPGHGVRQRGAQPGPRRRAARGSPLPARRAGQPRLGHRDQGAAPAGRQQGSDAARRRRAVAGSDRHELDDGAGEPGPELVPAGPGRRRPRPPRRRDAVHRPRRPPGWSRRSANCCRASGSTTTRSPAKECRSPARGNLPGRPTARCTSGSAGRRRRGRRNCLRTYGSTWSISERISIGRAGSAESDQSADIAPPSDVVAVAGDRCPIQRGMVAAHRYLRDEGASVIDSGMPGQPGRQPETESAAASAATRRAEAAEAKLKHRTAKLGILAAVVTLVATGASVVAALANERASESNEAAANANRQAASATRSASEIQTVATSIQEGQVSQIEAMSATIA